NPVQGATGYNIYRTTVSGSYTNSKIASTAGTSYQDAGAATTSFAPPSDSFAPPALLTNTIAAGGALAPLTTYYYAVSSTGPTSESTINAYQSITTSTAALGSLKVNLAWTVENNATGYRIYRSTTPITQANLSNDLIAVITAGTTAAFADSGTTFTLQGTTSINTAVLSNLA